MTREEAISVLKSYKEEAWTSYAEEALDTAIAALREQPQWISVEERLPSLDGTKTDNWGRQKSVRVLCSCKQKSGKVFVKEGYYVFHGDDVYWRIPGSIDCVTHWMPLPEPPKEEV